MEKMTKRKLQALNTRDKIYRTGVELMEKKGLNNTTVEEICKEANVSIGSFYNCFKSKNDILCEIFKVADDYFQNVVSDQLIGTAEDKIKGFFHYYADYNIERGIEFVKHLYTVQNNMFITKGRQMQAVLESIIEVGQEKGEIIAQQTPDEIVTFFFVCARGIVYDWCLHDGSYDLAERMDEYVTTLLRTVKAYKK